MLLPALMTCMKITEKMDSWLNFSLVCVYRYMSMYFIWYKWKTCSVLWRSMVFFSFFCELVSNFGGGGLLGKKNEWKICWRLFLLVDKYTFWISFLNCAKEIRFTQEELQMVNLIKLLIFLDVYKTDLFRK